MKKHRLIDGFDYDISKKIQKFVEWNALVAKSSGYQLNKLRTDYLKKTRRALSTSTPSRKHPSRIVHPKE